MSVNDTMEQGKYLNDYQPDEDPFKHLAGNRQRANTAEMQAQTQKQQRRVTFISPIPEEMASGEQSPRKKNQI